ncbi:hypothetical protein CONPUDRAFT_166134 [Coniophora puteana RWD-64-598 SS2]|uniref:Uncharacterized protein n=1 Tax=Coniophora puteana (strain RWD-64-598) TaxID=741705 RepID=A0A5M3MNK4_CONPW|nr:uncharacterized protein CONPUDRAFT_166134 [Coniophora puteana RWD-64-598 SS2]EIW80693.1 hypothetical protein CONPUDRAFT_166134 [Coniophora puteana RWD-64-598 SS2]
MPVPAVIAAIVIASFIAESAIIAKALKNFWDSRGSTATSPSTNPVETTARRNTYRHVRVAGEEDRQAAFELATIVASEVEEWRGEVHRNPSPPDAFNSRISLTIDRWEELLAQRRAMQQRRSAAAVCSNNVNPTDTTTVRHTVDREGEEENKQAIRELEAIIAREVEEWRNEVHGSLSRGNLSNSERMPMSELEEEAILSLQYNLLSPIDILRDLPLNGPGITAAHSPAASISNGIVNPSSGPNGTILTGNPSNLIIDRNADADVILARDQTPALTDDSLMPHDSISNRLSPVPGAVPSPPSVPTTSDGRLVTPPSDASTMRAPTTMSLQPISTIASLDLMFSSWWEAGLNLSEPISPPFPPSQSMSTQPLRLQSTETETQASSHPSPQTNVQAPISGVASSNTFTPIPQHIPFSPPQGSMHSLLERFQAFSTSPPAVVTPLGPHSARFSRPASSFATASPSVSTQSMPAPRGSRVQSAASPEYAEKAMLSPLTGLTVGSLFTSLPSASSDARSTAPVERSTPESGAGSGASAKSSPESQVAAPSARVRSVSVGSKRVRVPVGVVNGSAAMFMDHGLNGGALGMNNTGGEERVDEWAEAMQLINAHLIN